MIKLAILSTTLALAATAAFAAPQPKAAPKGAVQAALPAVPAAEIVERANAFLNSFDSISANFVQVNPDRRSFTGRVFLQRPGKARFDYDHPSPVEIVADGRNVMIRNRDTKSQQVYPINTTPLQFLLKDQLDLSRDMTLKRAYMTAQGAFVEVETSSALVGKSQVTLQFDAAIENLVQWKVVDAKGKATLVTLSGISDAPISDARMFDLNFQIQQR